MKKTLYLLTLTVLFSMAIGSASATVFRVNNALTENITSGLFKEIQTAHDHFSVRNGDTLMVEGSPIVYDNFICTKRLVIIGPGYFLGENSGVNGVVTSARTNNSYCYFNKGSEGSYLIGIECNYLYIQTSSIYVIRCKGQIQFSNSSSTPTANCKIANCYCTGINGYFGYNSNVSVTNCIVLEDNSDLNYLNYENNILVGKNRTWQISAGTFRNNVLIDRDVKVDIKSPNIQNNLAPNQQFGTANGNRAYEPADLFVGGTSSDGKYRIKANSPYIAAGYVGTQPGIFGGSEPYTLSGVPPVPIIYELNVPGTGSAATGLNINVKIRGAN